MVTVSAPFYDENKQFLGVTTGDIDITSIQKMIGNIKITKKSSANLRYRLQLKKHYSIIHNLNDGIVPF